MESGCMDCRLATFLTLSSLTYLAELTFQGLFVYHLYLHSGVVWFALGAGTTLLSLVATQFVSYQLRSQRHPTDRRRWLFVLCHVTLLGQLWRYGRLAASCRITITKREIWESFAVRIFVTFSSSLPVLCLSTYFILAEGFSHEESHGNWRLYSCAAVSLISVIWSLVTYRKLHHICCVLGSLPPSGGVLWKLPWRLGDVVARVLSVVVFAVAHGIWIFLVFILRWITMTILLVLDNHSQGKTSRAKLAASLFLNSFVHIFVRFNVSAGKSRLVLVLYHVISSAECVTLTVLWLLYEGREEYRLPVGLTIGVSLLVALVGAVCYYGCLQAPAKAPDKPEAADDACYVQCMTCRFGQLGRSNGIPAHVTVQENPNPQFCDLLHPSDFKKVRKQDAKLEQQRAEVREVVSRVSPTTPRPVNRAESFCQEGYVVDPAPASGAPIVVCDMSWDDYDMSPLSDETEFSPDRQYSDSASSLGTADFLRDQYEVREMSDHLVPLAAVKVTPNKDIGYFSGISSSSSNHQHSAGPPGPPPPPPQPKRPNTVPLFPNTCNGFWSDDASSTVTSVASNVHLVGARDRRRYYDTTSLDSLSTETTLTSQYTSEPILDIRHVMRHLYKQRFGAAGPRRKPRQKPRKRLQKGVPDSRRSYGGDTSSTHMAGLESDF